MSLHVSMCFGLWMCVSVLGGAVCVASVGVC